MTWIVSTQATRLSDMVIQRERKKERKKEKAKTKTLSIKTTLKMYEVEVAKRKK